MENSNLSFRSFFFGLMVAIIGGVMVAIIVQEGRFSPKKEVVSSSFTVPQDEHSLKKENETLEFSADLLTLQSIEFYETSSKYTSPSGDLKKVKFPSVTTRTINWNLNFEHPSFDKSTNFVIEFAYYKPDGRVLTKQKLDANLSGNTSSSNFYSGWGWEEPGSWEPGHYKVDFYVQNKVMGTGWFEIQDFFSIVSENYKVRVFESNYDGDNPNFGTRFPRNKARYINVELDFQHEPMGREIDFEIDCIYYRPSGGKETTENYKTSVEEDWEGSIQELGYGWDKAGEWDKGTWRIEILVNGKRLTDRKFEIY